MNEDVLSNDLQSIKTHSSRVSLLDKTPLLQTLKSKIFSDNCAASSLKINFSNYIPSTLKEIKETLTVRRNTMIDDYELGIEKLMI